MSDPSADRAERERAEKVSPRENIKEYLAQFANSNLSFRLRRTYPEYVNGVAVKGYLRAYSEPPGEEEIKAEFGGGDFVMQVVDPNDNSRIRGKVPFSIYGTPLAPQPAQVASQGVPFSPAPGSSPAVFPADQPLVKRFVDASIADANKAAEEKQSLEKERLQLATANARLEAERATFTERLAFMQSQLDRLANAQTENPKRKSDEMLHEREMVKIGLEAQRDALTAKDKQLDLMRAQMSEYANSAAEPFRQLINDLKERHQSELANTQNQANMMMEFFKQSSSQQTEFLRMQISQQQVQADARAAELRAQLESIKSEKRSGVLGDLASLAKGLKELKGLKSLMGADEEEKADIAERLVDMLPDLAEKMPAISAALRHLATGEGINMSGLPVPSKPVEELPKGPTPEEIKQAELHQLAEVVMASVKDAWAKRADPRAVANSILTSNGKIAGRLLLGQSADDLVKAVKAQHPEFGDVEADLWLRKLYQAVAEAMGV